MTITLERSRAAVAANPFDVDARNTLCAVCYKMGLFAEALAQANAAIAINSKIPEFFKNGGAALLALGRFGEARAYYTRALELNPNYFEARQYRALVAENEGQIDLALSELSACFDAKQLLPEFAPNLLFLSLQRAQWADYERLMVMIRKRLPHLASTVLAWTLDDPAQQLAAQKACSACFRIEPASPLPVCPPGDRIRLAYVSADFRRHPVTTMLTPLLEQHDRSRFEIIGISLGPDDQSRERARILSAFDEVLDARAMTDEQVTDWLRRRGVDIALDLMGYTTFSRPRIFAGRAAPIQAAFVGDPITTGAPWMDVIIADQFVIPSGDERFYAERVERLPHCYHPPNPALEIGETPTREQAGLPADGFVFASFANTWKINPGVFDVWIELLRAVDHSVLWLIGNTGSTMANLRSEAERRGLDASRIIFAPRATQAEHLARHRLADLGLDAWPYGGHTTTFEALLVGVPVVTWSGKTFTSRVAGSMLHAAGAPELVALSPAAYSALALGLARDPARLASLRHRISAQVKSSPLFDLDRYRRDLEALYEDLVNRGTGDVVEGEITQNSS